MRPCQTFAHCVKPPSADGNIRSPRVVDGKDTLIWSWVISFENALHPRPGRRDEIALWKNRAASLIELSAGIKERARQLEEQGMPALDAAHLASAEAGGADVFVTCDDVIARRARRLKLGLRVVNPVAYWEQMVPHG